MLSKHRRDNLCSQCFMDRMDDKQGKVLEHKWSDWCGNGSLVLMPMLSFVSSCLEEQKMKEDRNQDLREVEEAVGWQEGRRKCWEETVEGSKWLDCTLHLLYCLKSVRFLPATSSPKARIWDKEEVTALIVAYSELRFCIALGVGRAGFWE